MQPVVDLVHPGCCNCQHASTLTRLKSHAQETQIGTTREKEGLQSKGLTASLFTKGKKFMKTYEKTVHGEWHCTVWQTSKEPPERKDEIERGEGQTTGKHIYVGENRPGGEHTEKNIMFILHIIMGIAEVTGRRSSIVP
eukprot:837993-Pelagomonas_calceolata.AAC.1